MDVIKRFGYDFDRGRLDKTHHPFMTKFSLGDVRITTRVAEDFLGEALFSTMHEAGHAMYEQGIRIRRTRARRWPAAHRRACTRASRGCGRTSSAAAGASGSTSTPSSSRFSRNSWARCRSTRSTAPSTRCERSLIRTDADEVTYNLHVMIRFDLELALLEGTLAVDDLPEAWRARYQADLGIAAPDDKDGVLQDVHWYGGVIGGAFQGYTLGNILGAQFYAAAAQGASRHPGRDRARRVRHAARLAAREHLPARQQVHRARADRARHRRPAEHRAVRPISAGEVRGAVSAVATPAHRSRRPPAAT